MTRLMVPELISSFSAVTLPVFSSTEMNSTIYNRTQNSLRFENKQINKINNNNK